MKETTLPLNIEYKDNKVNRAAHLASTLADDLEVGEYMIKYRTPPVIFARIDKWDNSLDINTFITEGERKLVLSDMTEIEFLEEEIEKIKEIGDQCRIVLLSETGFSSFLVDLTIG